MATAIVSDDAGIATLRAFNRVYTRRLGLLHDRLDASPFSLAEARVLYELAHRVAPIASVICDALEIDPAQLSRILHRFEKAGLVERRQSPHHAKHKLLRLTRAGRSAFRALNESTDRAVGAFLQELPRDRRTRMLVAARSMTDILEPREDQPQPRFLLRAPCAGDLGWVIHRQAVLYAQEYGWDWTYEALAAEILARFIQRFDAAREQAWMAEADGGIVGSVFLMSTPDPATAKLRLLYVEPAARSMGIGRALVDTCIERARSAGYQTLELWTNTVLVSARRIYQAAGFQLKEEAPHHSFGHSLMGQIWTLDLLHPSFPTTDAS